MVCMCVCLHTGTVDDLVIGTEGLMSTSTGEILAPGWKQPRAFDITFWTPSDMVLPQGRKYFAHVKVCPLCSLVCLYVVVCTLEV